MSLHVETTGSGPDLLLLHGWGLHGGVFDTVAPKLAKHFRVTRVDLPGHGLSRDTPMPATLTDVARLVLDSVPMGAAWLGWSLGGMVAQRAALDAPRNIRGLILCNTTPRFTTAADWPHAMPPAQLQEFAAGLVADYRETLQHFLSLQVRGDEAAREALRELREAVFARGEPDAASLATGLTLLRDSDLRAGLKDMKLPTLLIAGGYDRITPPGASVAMAEHIPGAKLLLMEKSAHAPFISHAEAFMGAVLDFMQSMDREPARTRKVP